MALLGLIVVLELMVLNLTEMGCEVIVLFERTWAEWMVLLLLLPGIREMTQTSAPRDTLRERVDSAIVCRNVHYLVSLTGWWAICELKVKSTITTLGNLGQQYRREEKCFAAVFCSCSIHQLRAATSKPPFLSLHQLRDPCCTLPTPPGTN